jgi:hypothetical protein
MMRMKSKGSKKGGKTKKYQAGTMVSPDERAIERGNAAMDRISEEGTTNMMEAKDPRSMRPKKRPTDPRSMRPKKRPTSKPKSILKPTRDGKALTTKSLLQPRADGTGLTTKPEKMKAGGMTKKKGYAKGGMMKKGYKAGGKLKQPDADNVGLKKLPESVRNNMGYMAKGGMAKKGYAKGGMMKKGYKKGGKIRGYGMARGGKVCKIR